MEIERAALSASVRRQRTCVGRWFVVGAAYLGWRLLSRWRPLTAARTPALYAIGSLAAYWSITRIVAILA